MSQCKKVKVKTTDEQWKAFLDEDESVLENGRSISQLAKIFNCGRNAARNIVKRLVEKGKCEVTEGYIKTDDGRCIYTTVYILK